MKQQQQQNAKAIDELCVMCLIIRLDCTRPIVCALHVRLHTTTIGT